MKIATPYTDEALETFTLRTEEVNLNEEITEGQKVIVETILGRKAPDGSGRKRAHFLAHTRFGKSIAVAAGIAIRASIKGEKWAIVAPTQDQAQIIMDYVIEISVNDPIISELLRDDVAKAIKKERLTQRRARNHITYLKGGEVRTYAAGSTMGFGAQNVVLDEAGLIDNDTESKIFRMLGDNTDNFYVKIGNPWRSIDDNGDVHHFLDSFTNQNYFSVNYDYYAGLAMGRLTKSYIDEVKKKPNFDILYENIYPDTDKVDKGGYMTLFSHKALKKAIIEAGKIIDMAGVPVLGVDPNDSGENEAVLVKRGMNLARIELATTGFNNITITPEIHRVGRDCQYWNIDKQGVGAGTVNILKKQPEQISSRVVPVNSGLPVPEHIENHEDYENLRAYMFWKAAEWLNTGRLEGTIEDWRQLLAVRYKNNRRGKVQIISKQELLKRGVNDLGRADAFSYTFMPKKKQMPKNAKVTGGVEPLYRTMPDTGRRSDGPNGYDVVAAQQPKKKDEPYYPPVSFQ